MGSTIGGDDSKHDLSPEEKDREEAQLRRLARVALVEGRFKERKRLDARAVEISRRKARKAHQ
jgi:hypothetical protein